MIEIIYFCGELVPDDRMLTAVSLYSDFAVVPLCHMPDETLYNDLIARLPDKDRQLVHSHATLADRFKGLSQIITFPSLYKPDRPGDTSLDALEHIGDLIDKFPVESPTPLLHVLNEIYALGFFHGLLDALGNKPDHIVIPVSDHDVIASPIFPHKPNGRLADILSSWLAVEAIRLSLPDIEPVHPVEILWARERLADELSGFRAAMYRLAADLRDMVKSEEELSVEHVRSEAQFLTKTHVLPAVMALQNAVRLQKRSFARHLTVRALDTFKLVVKCCCAPNPIKVAELASAAAGGAIDFNQYCDEIAKLNNENAISYLAKLPELFPRRQVK